VTEDIFNELKPYCRKDERLLLNKFRNQGYDVRELSNGDYYAFKDNGSNVLAVAHMDIASTKLNIDTGYRLEDSKVYSPALDDRLGVFIITKILPMLGVVPDILLTTGEEKGQSTGMYFDTSKKYNWMFSFDRCGDDVVMYDYETTALVQMLEETGFIVGKGSFSDICWMEHLSVSGFNFGTGYYGEHTKRCYADLDVTRFMVALFVDFFEEFKNIKFDYVPIPYEYRYGAGWQNDKLSYDSWEDYDDELTDSLGWKPIGYNDECDNMDDIDDYAHDGELHTVREAIAFEDKHSRLGHDVDTFPIDDIVMGIVCFDCDEQILFYE